MKSILVRIFHRIQPLWTACNEFTLNVQTVDADPQRGGVIRGMYSPNSKHGDNYIYGSPDYWYIRKIVDIVGPTTNDVVYDLGSGMGRILSVVARRNVDKCVGVELLEPLCEISRRNASRLRGRKAPIEIICGDCSTVDMSDGTIYFMFNPFGAETLRDTLAHIGRSMVEKPRIITLVYYNPTHENLLRSTGWLRQYDEFRTISGLRVSFWRSDLTGKPHGFEKSSSRESAQAI